MIDADHIRGGLWVGSYPNPDDGRELGRRFDTILFCAEEYRPAARYFKPADCLYLPMKEYISKDRDLIVDGACIVDDELQDRRKVLVTCRQGANRSGVIAAAALMLHYDMHPREAVALLRRQRQVPSHDPNGRYSEHGRPEDWRHRGRAPRALYLREYEDYLYDKFWADLERRDRRDRKTRIRDTRGTVYLEPGIDDDVDGLSGLGTSPLTTPQPDPEIPGVSIIA